MRLTVKLLNAAGTICFSFTILFSEAGTIMRVAPREQTIFFTAIPALEKGNGPHPITAQRLISALEVASASVFFFFIFKKIKISKIYVCFEKFQKWPPVARPRGDRVLSPKQWAIGP